MLDFAAFFIELSYSRWTNDPDMYSAKVYTNLVVLQPQLVLKKAFQMKDQHKTVHTLSLLQHYSITTWNPASYLDKTQLRLFDYKRTAHI